MLRQETAKQAFRAQQQRRSNLALTPGDNSTPKRRVSNIGVNTTTPSPEKKRQKSSDGVPVPGSQKKQAWAEENEAPNASITATTAGEGAARAAELSDMANKLALEKENVAKLNKMLEEFHKRDMEETEKHQQQRAELEKYQRESSELEQRLQLANQTRFDLQQELRTVQEQLQRAPRPEELERLREERDEACRTIEELSKASVEDFENAESQASEAQRELEQTLAKLEAERASRVQAERLCKLRETKIRYKDEEIKRKEQELQKLAASKDNEIEVLKKKIPSQATLMKLAAATKKMMMEQLVKDGTISESTLAEKLLPKLGSSSPLSSSSSTSSQPSMDTSPVEVRTRSARKKAARAPKQVDISLSTPAPKETPGGLQQTDKENDQGLENGVRTRGQRRRQAGMFSHLLNTPSEA